MSPLRLPPYARDIITRRRAGWHPAGGWLFVFAGPEVWGRTKHWRTPARLAEFAVTLIPIAEPPHTYSWACARGLAVYVNWPGLPAPIGEDFARILLGSGAERVLVDGVDRWAYIGG